MSPEEKVYDVAAKIDRLADEISAVKDRVEDLENEHEAIVNIPNAVSELKGMVTVLQAAVTQGFDGVQQPLQQAADGNSAKNAIQFAAIVLVPILVALIGAYVAIKTGSSGK